ncbi:hypothetical protein NCU01886 [Neurospora crassa OR74A]|uniref:Zn(2)-C6 fungal-type domain-containing protein n=1 Tax=Neurospora crassa (strain ATCC 24698 / 74-OR23-1A / CBS 708.71 / DSM 1257 / FGSC 987) TaxID=367110 RepID=Q7SHC0_NEUCR|nr:hypothetical protein NCU01886 [Neurospora crassa OR74A]EAA36281.1 hypothetical protein NCU01886 [Neurospora crassa OR74A]|eukprot:XP_965517.1 hypothetical protein NCU01886 [Neurospora crassa OR74A]
MAGISPTNSANAFMEGFSVCQANLGEALTWLPAMGTPELDDMINAFIPGPASIKDKRAHISMDFLSYSQRTGFNFKFYPVPSTSFTPASIASSASSSQFVDSGYASSFNVSPVISDSSAWTQSPASFTSPAAFDDATRIAKARSSTSTTKKSTSPSSRHQVVDFANHPGMRIMTKDGRDVTNSASRGCKTKEQRDHAHLMRIIKACDACRKRKVRCDPSHKKRAASHTSPAATESKPTKKQRKETAEAPPPAPVVVETTPELLDVNHLENFDAATFVMPSVEGIETVDDNFWNRYFNFDQDVFPDFTPGTFDQFTPSQELFYQSTSSSSAASPSQVFTPETPVHSRPSPAIANEPVVATAAPALPYLNPGVPHGTEFVDFNLYSPPADFSLDEELLGLGQQQSHAPFDFGYADQQYFGDASVVAHRAESRSSPSSPSVSGVIPSHQRLPLEVYGGLPGSEDLPTLSNVSPAVQAPGQLAVQQQQEQQRYRQLASGNESRVIPQSSVQQSVTIGSGMLHSPASPASNVASSSLTALNVRHAPHNIDRSVMNVGRTDLHRRSPIALQFVNAGESVNAGAATQHASSVEQQSRAATVETSARLKSPVKYNSSVHQGQKQGFAGLPVNLSTTSRDVSSGICHSSASNSTRLGTTTTATTTTASSQSSTTTTILPGRRESGDGEGFAKIGAKLSSYTTSASSSSQSSSFPLVVLGLVSCLVVAALRTCCSHINDNWGGHFDPLNTLFIASLSLFSLWLQSSFRWSVDPDTHTTSHASVQGLFGSSVSRQAKALVASNSPFVRMVSRSRSIMI